MLISMLISNLISISDFDFRIRFQMSISDFIELPTAKSARGQIGKVAEKGFLGWRYLRLFADVCVKGAERFDFYRKWDPKSSNTKTNR